MPKPSQSFACHNCPMHFTNDTALQIHILEVHRNVNAIIVPPRCNPCDTDFETQAAYEKHMQFHKIIEKKQAPRPKAFPCKHCPASFNNVELLHTHFKQYHRDPSQPGHMCPVCNRVFERPQALATHIKIHGRDHVSQKLNKPAPKQAPPKVAKKFLYSCSICHIGFNVPKELRNHIISAHPF